MADSQACRGRGREIEKGDRGGGKGGFVCSRNYIIIHRFLSAYSSDENKNREIYEMTEVVCVCVRVCMCVYM